MPGESKKENKLSSGLEGRIAYILMKSGVTGPEIDECMEWAFGPGAWYVPIWPDWPDRWHKLHPKGMRIKRKDNLVEIIYVIGFLFTRYKKDLLKSQSKKG